jgi:hypothetical protein
MVDVTNRPNVHMGLLPLVLLLRHRLNSSVIISDG